MDIQFFDEPGEGPKSREDVRILQVGFFVYEDLRRVAVGLELTPFLERPSIELTVINGNGVRAGSLTIIETMTPNLTLTMHLRDAEPTEQYSLTAVVYYATPETERQDVQTVTVGFEVVEPGEQIVKLEE